MVVSGFFPVCLRTQRWQGHLQPPQLCGALQLHVAHAYDAGIPHIHFLIARAPAFKVLNPLL